MRLPPGPAFSYAWHTHANSNEAVRVLRSMSAALRARFHGYTVDIMEITNQQIPENSTVYRYILRHVVVDTTAQTNNSLQTDPSQVALTHPTFEQLEELNDSEFYNLIERKIDGVDPSEWNRAVSCEISFEVSDEMVVLRGNHILEYGQLLLCVHREKGFPYAEATIHWSEVRRLPRYKLFDIP